MIRVLLVDDQSIIRRGLKALLKFETSLQIIGEAENGEMAIAQVEALQPDVVLMDIRMPIMDGVAATREIKQRFGQTQILILTTFDDQEYVTQALKYGAAGYLLKDTPPEELVQGIQAVAKGYTHLSPGLMTKLMQFNNTSVTSNTAPIITPPGWDELTPREKEILELIGEGATNREIAEKLYISEKTVKNHLTHIFSRLNLRDRTQAAILVNSLKNK